MSSNKNKKTVAGMKKQGNLFSFFTKKKATAPTAAAAASSSANTPAKKPAAKSSSSSSRTGSSSPAAASDASSPAPANATTLAARNTNPNPHSSHQARLLQKVHVGCTVAVLWPDDDEYYPARVTGKQVGSNSIYTLLYEDGECETIDLGGERFRFLSKAKAKSKGKRAMEDDGDDAKDAGVGGTRKNDDDVAAAAAAAAGGGGGGGGSSKKRRILEESEEEYEFDDEDEDEMSVGTDGGNASPSDGSEFIDDDDDYDEEGDEDTLMVTDEDDDEVAGGRGRASRDKGKGKASNSSSGGGGKRLRVTRVENSNERQMLTPNSGGGAAGASTASKRAPFITPPPSSSSSSAAAAGGVAATMAKNAFSDFAMAGALDDEKEGGSLGGWAAGSISKSKAITPGASGRKATKVKPTSAAAANSSSDVESAMPPASASGMPTSGAPAFGAATPAASKTTLPFSKPSLPVDKTVNPAGTHWHNHFKFLHPHHVRDSSNRPMSDPNYDARTLKVDFREIERISGKISGGQKQWWDLKARYFDTILLFKTGKFYEIFHMDADAASAAAARTPGSELNYMKGQSAHVGFPEAAYGKFTDLLVRAGYKVARVEQTETPEMLKERKKGIRRGEPKPQVVNREVCSISSAGTRTFCYMDKEYCFGEENSGGSNAGVGPLLVIKEVMVDTEEQHQQHQGQDMDVDDCDGDEEEDRGVRPVCEYGVAIIDAVRGCVSLGQFADDVLRSRMVTLLTTFTPSEILIEGGENGASDTLLSLLKATAATSPAPPRIERVNPKETFPRSNAVDSEIRKKIERPSSTVRPWNVDETIAELHRRGYYPRASRKTDADATANDPDRGVGRWPEVLRVCVRGGASLALSAFGAALFYLQRSLIDEEILTMGIVKAYVPPGSPAGVDAGGASLSSGGGAATATEELQRLSAQEEREEGGIYSANGDSGSAGASASLSRAVEFSSLYSDQAESIAMENQIDHMTLDGTTLANLEILANSHSNTAAGSLWSKINHTKSPHGSRLLRAWLLRPLFRKADIDRRADAVEELASGGPAVAMSEARAALAKTGDVQRLLSRVHSMGGTAASGGDAGHHPNERAVLYESAMHTKRKVGDFSKLLNGLRAAATIPELFDGIDIQSGLLSKIIRTTDDGGCFPANLTEQLDWFFDNFDCNRASKGLFEPTRGMDEQYDAACDTIEQIRRELDDYKQEMCSEVLKPSHVAKGQWKYVNIKGDSKDKYLIELPASLRVPDEFFMKGKRGSGAKQVNKYRTPVIERLVQDMEQAIEIVNAGKARGMQVVFARFDSMRSLWAAAAQATAMLDALGALAETASKPGFARPIIMDCPPDGKPCAQVTQGRHPCVEHTHSGGEFIPNDLSLGGDESGGGDESRVLLLSGPNMGGKSTLLRQTCLITILAQIGCFVPAEQCAITPVDRIFTRLGASDRILLGQSTFFVELAETAAALRGATRRSLVIMDELGRGTSTFDGTAIASAAVKHLVERNMCLALFATHYHSLLEDWSEEPIVRLGHMECLVEGFGGDGHNADEHKSKDHNITFLYTLGEGSCPKSFGINVARLAALPEEVLTNAKQVSTQFEAEMNGSSNQTKVSPSNAVSLRKKIEEAVAKEDWDKVEDLWEALQV